MNAPRLVLEVRLLQAIVEGTSLRVRASPTMTKASNFLSARKEPCPGTDVSVAFVARKPKRGGWGQLASSIEVSRNQVVDAPESDVAIQVSHAVH